LRTMVTTAGLDVAILAQLVWGAWASTLSAESLAALLDLMLNDDRHVASEGAIAILDQWADAHGAELPPVLERMALSLLQRPFAGSKDPMTSFYWSRLAGSILPRMPVLIAR